MTEYLATIRQCWIVSYQQTSCSSCSMAEFFPEQLRWCLIEQVYLGVNCKGRDTVLCENFYSIIMTQSYSLSSPNMCPPSNTPMPSIQHARVLHPTRPCPPSDTPVSSIQHARVLHPTRPCPPSNTPVSSIQHARVLHPTRPCPPSDTPVSSP